MKTKTFGMSEYMYTCNYQGRERGGEVVLESEYLDVIESVCENQDIWNE